MSRPDAEAVAEKPIIPMVVSPATTTAIDCLVIVLSLVRAAT
jgi:hypothetical protein